MNVFRAERTRALRRADFEALPGRERETLALAFERRDVDRRGVLEPAVVATCCWELGLGGTCLDEKAEVHKICNEVGDGDGLHLFDFALEVVPRVRARLLEMRQEEMRRHFEQQDHDNDGHLSQVQCMAIARVMGLDARMVWDAAEACENNLVSFDVYLELISSARERLQLVMRQREYEIREHYELDDSMFTQFRRDLVVLHDLFHQYDSTRRGFLIETDVMFIVKDIGLMPKTKVERNKVGEILKASDEDGNGEFTFAEFLHLVDRIRKSRQAERREELRDLFRQYSRDTSGNLSIAEISALLAQMGIMPTNRSEQEELAELIISADDDGSGTIGFDEFLTLCQQIEEKVIRMNYEHEVELAISLGFTDGQLRDFKWVFDMIDADGSGELDLQEVHSGLLLMQRPISQDRLRRMFRGLGEVTTLEFTGFLRLMHLLKQEEGEFSEEAPIAALEVQNLESRVLRRVLEQLKLPKNYVAALPHDELLDLFCRHFQVRRAANVFDALSVKTVPALYFLARDLQVKTLKKVVEAREVRRAM